MERKHLISILLIITISLINCNSLKTSNIIGTWKISGKYTSIGETRNFEKVTSERTITLKKDGTFYSNGNMCSRDINDMKPSSGKFYLDKSKDKVYILQPNDCEGISGANIMLNIKEKKLQINYPSSGYYYFVYERVN